MLNRRSFLRLGGAASASLVVAGTGKAEAARGGGAAAGRGGADPDWAQLRQAFQGDVVLPGDPDYAFAKQLEIAQYDAVNPKAVAYAVSADDVSAAIRFCGRY